jgi:magnesium transporter
VQTALAGIYGMNFADIPGLSWRYGFATMIGVMVVASVVLYRRLTKVGWL